MEPELRLWCDGALLVWYGRILELFTPGTTGGWRVHPATIVRWELEPRRGVKLLKIWLTRKHYDSVLFLDADEPMVRHIMSQVDADS